VRSDLGWFGLAYNPAGGIAAVTYYAVCSDAYLTRYRSEPVKVKPGDARKVIARCRDDEAVLGGGVASLFDDFGSAGARPRGCAGVTHRTSLASAQR